MVAITYNLSDKTSSHNGVDSTAEIPLQAIALDLPLHASRALIRDIRAGKGALVELGRQPELRCGKQTFSLKATPSRFPSDLYRRKARGSNDYELLGSVHHDLSLVEAEKSSAAMDAAVAQLKNSLASYQQEKEANKTTILSASPNVPTAHGKRSSVGTRKLFPVSKKAARWPKGALQRPDSSQTATRSNVPQSSPLPDQQPQKATIQKALRFAVLHLLAIKPITMKAIIQRTRCKEEDCLDILRKIGKQTSSSADEWHLTEKAYKELDVWNFRYLSQELRQSVIDNAVRVFDRLRISPEDQQWQMLLPKHDRGKGITLSKLKLNPQPNKPIRKMTPITKSAKKPAPSKKANKTLTTEEGKQDSVDEEGELFDDGGQESADVQGQGPAEENISPTTIQVERELPGQDDENGHNATGSKERDRYMAEDKAAGTVKKTSLDDKKTGKTAGQPKKSKVDGNPFAGGEKKAGDAAKAKSVALRDKDAKTKRPLTPANVKSKTSAASPRLAEKKAEKQSADNQKANPDIKEQTYSQNSPRGNPSSSAESIKKPAITASSKPITAPWQPRKDRPVIRKGPKSPASRKSSQAPSEKNIVNNNNASQDKDSARRLSTKPKIPSPLGAEPMVNTSSSSPLTVKPASQSGRDSIGNSDAGLKRKANDLDAKDDSGPKSEGIVHKHRKTNPSTSSLSSLSSQTTSSSVKQPSAVTGARDGEKSLKRKSATSNVEYASNSPSKSRRVDSKTSTPMKATNNATVGKVTNAGNKSETSMKPSIGLKPVPKPASKVASSTSTSSEANDSRSARATTNTKSDAFSEERRITQPKPAENTKPRHSPSNSASTVSSTSSDSNTSNKTSISTTAPALTSASTSASNSDVDEATGGAASPLRMSFRQTVEHARKFQKYYVPYAELYERLSSSSDPPSEKDRATLMGMHEKLSVMKMEIRSGALRQT